MTLDAGWKMEYIKELCRLCPGEEREDIGLDLGQLSAGESERLDQADARVRGGGCQD